MFRKFILLTLVVMMMILSVACSPSNSSEVTLPQVSYHQPSIAPSFISEYN
jgi:hypothetical protein